MPGYTVYSEDESPPSRDVLPPNFWEKWQKAFDKFVGWANGASKEEREEALRTWARRHAESKVTGRNDPIGSDARIADTLTTLLSKDGVDGEAIVSETFGKVLDKKDAKNPPEDGLETLV